MIDQRIPWRKLILLVAVLSIFPLFSLSSLDNPVLEPQELFLRYYGSEPDAESVLRLGLAFSGITGDRANEYIGEFFTHINRFLNSGLPDKPDEIGEAILAYLHKNIFVRYEEFETDLDRVLDAGLYNCVSSAVVYSAFALASGLEVKGVSTTDHAFCAVGSGDNWIDVETTSIYGFNPGTKTEFQDNFGRTGFSYVPPGNYSQREDRSVYDLVSLVGMNRMSLLERRNNFQEALPIAVNRHALLQSNESHENLDRAVKNFISLLNNKNAFQQALDFMELYQELYGERASLDDLESAMVNNMIVSLIQRENYDQAILLLDDTRLNSRVRNELNLSLGEVQLYNLAQNKIYSELKSDLNYWRGKVRDSFFADLVVSTSSAEAKILAEQGEYLGARDVLSNALEFLGNDSRLVRGIQIYENNFAISIHNRYVQLYNAGKYDEAEAVIRSGLEIIPDNSMLKKDLQTVLRAK
jgi:tetratricopeptide (TPR) repeat protein